MLQEKEEQLLKKRMIELAGLCYQRDIQTSTGFLSLNEQTIFHSIVAAGADLSDGWL